MTTLDSIAEFAATVGIMKPNAPKKGDKKAEAKLDALLDSPDYIIEEKVDGCRYKLVGERFFSKDNKEKTLNFPHVVKFLKQLRMKNLILDGEMHYPGKTSQYAVSVTGANTDNAIAFQEQNGYIHYTIYDILRTPKSSWLIKNTYLERRKLLEHFYEKFVMGTEMEEFIHISEMRHEGKREYVEDLIARGLEGGVLKQKTSLYMMGKSPMWQWMKIKKADSTDLVIMGFLPGKKDYEGKELSSWKYWEDDPVTNEPIPVTKAYAMGWIGRIILGAYVDGTLTKICTAAGFKESLQEDMTNNPDSYIGRVARVDFMELTTDGFPRHPTFKDMHEDKMPEECTWEF
jgi:ATP-dependent DNA ligase